ncbi:uncharacterized protein LOC144158273 isoform X8 [Haemaphysalis longicornis]
MRRPSSGVRRRTRNSVPHALTLLTLNSCVSAMATDGPCSQDVSCNQQIQATIATSAIGTQCALTLTLLISASSQTEKQFSVPKEEDTQPGTPLERHRASRGGVGLAGKSGHHSCSCRPLPGKKSKSVVHRESQRSAGVQSQDAS